MHSDNLLREDAGRAGDAGPLVALQGEFILLLSGDGELPGQVFRSLPNVQPAERVHESLLDADHGLEISQPEAREHGELPEN